jgi:hypothetical protein
MLTSLAVVHRSLRGVHRQRRVNGGNLCIGCAVTRDQGTTLCYGHRVSTADVGRMGTHDTATIDDRNG